MTADGYIDPHQLLDCDDVAALLKVSRKWVEDKVAADEIQYTRIGARLVRFTRDDIDALFKAGKHGPADLPKSRRLGRIAGVAQPRRGRAA